MSAASVVYIARHGERIDHVDKSWVKNAERPHDPYLTEVGIQQAAALGTHLMDKKLNHIFCSPFYRTIQTANEVSKATDVPISLEPGLSEWLNPTWYPTKPPLLSIETLKDEFPAIDLSHKPLLHPDYPECHSSAVARSEDIAKGLASRHGGNILFVSHGLVCEYTARGLTDTGKRPYISYCSLQTCVLRENSTDRYSIHGADEPDISFLTGNLNPSVKRSYQ